MVSLNDLIAEGVKCDPDKEALAYNEDGDFLSVFIDHSNSYSKRVDDLLTVYYAIEDGKMTGFKIKGVKRLLDRLGSLGVQCDHGDMSVAVLILGVLSFVSQDNFHHYKELADNYESVRFDPSLVC